MNLNHPNEGHSSFPPQLNTISLGKAIERTTNWREQIAGLFTTGDEGGEGDEGDEAGGKDDGARGGLKDAIPKCLHINLMDVYQIVEDYKLLGYDISGIRVYFTLQNENAKKDYHVTGIVVPTVWTQTGISDSHRDLITRIPVIDNNTGQETTGDSVYDFTRPCPPYCSGTTGSLTGES
jgi:hypothetical protein